MGTPEVFVDEEAALGFHVWVAELELLVGTAKGRQIDQVRDSYRSLYKIEKSVCLCLLPQRNAWACAKPQSKFRATRQADSECVIATFCV